MTPLMYAAREGRLEIVQLLLDSGAEIDRQDTRGWTVSHSFTFPPTSHLLASLGFFEGKSFGIFWSSTLAPAKCIQHCDYKCYVKKVLGKWGGLSEL